MGRAAKYLLGIWAGATALACAAAYLWAFVATGRLAVPSGRGFRLVPVDEATASLAQWAEVALRRRG